MSIKRMPMMILALLALLVLSLPLVPCSTFFVQGKNMKWFGRNYDFFTHTGFVVVNPRGVSKQALVYPGEIPAGWSSTYGSITFNQVGQEFPTGGMNEAGLVIECMWLVETQYPVKDSRPCIMEMQWMQYILDTCGTIDEVKQSLQKVRIMQGSQTIHFLVSDRRGRAAVIEFISLYPFVYPVGNKLPAALTNSSYADSLHYLQGFKGFGGKEEIRKSINSVDRFVQLAAAIKDQAPTLEKAFSWLNMVSVAPGPAGDSYTSWSIVYDPAALAIHFKLFGQEGIRVLNFSDFSFACNEGAQALDLEAMLPGKGLKEQFLPLGTEWNTSLVKRTFAIFKKNNFMTSMPDLYLDVLGKYPASLKCRGE